MSINEQIFEMDLFYLEKGYKPHLHLEQRTQRLDDEALFTFVSRVSSSSSLSDDIDDRSDASLLSSIPFMLKPK